MILSLVDKLKLKIILAELNVSNDSRHLKI
jgi:hypothetical protein